MNQAAVEHLHPEETHMPPSTVETKLLALLGQHLEDTGRSITELKGGMDRLADKFESASNRIFYLALLLVVAVVATSGANLVISYRQAGGALSVATGGAAAPVPEAGVTPPAPPPSEPEPSPAGTGRGARRGDILTDIRWDHDIISALLLREAGRGQVADTCIARGVCVLYC